MYVFCVRFFSFLGRGLPFPIAGAPIIWGLLGVSRYRNIHCLIWNDDKFPFVSDDCQLVFFHLLTTPLSTPFGLYKASIEALAKEKRWPVKRYLKAFREAFGKPFVKYDERHLVVFIPHFLKYNPPNNPNVLKSWAPTYREIPDCDLKAEFYQELRSFAEKEAKIGKAFREVFTKAFGEPCRKPPATDTDSYILDLKEEEGSGEKRVDKSDNGVDWPSVELLVELYNSVTPEECPEVELISPKRREKANRYLMVFPKREFWERVFSEIAHSTFLRGFTRSKGHEHFIASFDWLLTKGQDGTENCVKVWEGNYRDGK